MRVVDAAERLFLTDGYAATTVAGVAAAAGVSVDTIYKGFGGKPGLVRAIRDRGLEGSEAVPAEQRSDALHSQGLTGEQIIRAWGRFVAEVAPRTAPILLLMRDAAVDDAEMRALQAESDRDRLRRMTHNARRLRAGGHLRAGVSIARAADVCWCYTAAELYELLVVRRGWSINRYSAFVTDALLAALL
jgi:AcrR family transcriptional regulator